MTAIATLRLQSQHIGARTFTTPHAVVSHLGAVQAQDYLGALWAVGLRMRDAVEEDVERALAERTIVRTWPMRGTLHFIAAEDARWMLELCATRVAARNVARHEREYGLTKVVMRRARGVVARALEGRKHLTREELYARLAVKQGGLHILWHLAHERLICFGPRRGKQQTFVLFDEWLPGAKPRERDDALGELARRYFTSHAPATLADFVWWSGLTVTEARRAMQIAGPVEPEPRRAMRIASVHLLPPYDEFTVAYRDRGAVLDPAFAKRINAGGGVIAPVMIVNGMVAGRWARALRGKQVEITTSLFRTLTEKEQRALADAEKRYTRFLECGNG